MVEPLAVYIHWPYCARICPYCDFNVYKQRSADEDLVAAICEDLKGWRRWSGPREVGSIHFGGGTPSLMPAKAVGLILKTIKALWSVSGDSEIAMEANPGDAVRPRWKDYANAGVGRLSLGVQSFHDPALILLGRDHNADQAREALALALEIFPSVSLDLIFGWMGQTETLLEKDLDEALACGAQHISAYQLTIEDGTAFSRAETRGNKKSVPQDISADFYDLVHARLSSENFEHYEVSNFAKPGHRSRHNLAYWHGQDYVGVGPGAHGRINVSGQKHATIAAMHPKDYKTLTAKTGKGLAEIDILSASAWAEEYLLMGLRISGGISCQRFKEIKGEPLPEKTVKDFAEQGLIVLNGDRLRATDKGRLVLNTVTQALLIS